jgi:uncharacterized protein YhaN
MWPRRKGKDKQESEDALNEAKNNLKEIKKRTAQVEEVVEALRELREGNHFAEQLEELIVRRRRSTT